MSLDQPHSYNTPMDATEKNWVLLCHLGPLVGSFVAPVLAMFIPLGVMLFKGDTSPTIKEHAVETTNFQLSFLIYSFVAAIAIIALVGLLLIPVVAIAWFVLCIIGSLKAANGELYRYPLTIRFIR